MRILTALGNNPRIDRNRIGIMGFSKGGTSALVASHERQLAQAGVPAGLRYALHVPFYPSCAVQFYQPRTSGKPIYMLLGGGDTYVGFQPCQDYAETIRATGGRVEVTVYPGAMHGFDGGRAYNNTRGENYADCVFQQKADGSFVEKKSGVTTIGADGRAGSGRLRQGHLRVSQDGRQRWRAGCRCDGIDGCAQELRSASPVGWRLSCSQ